MPPSWLAVTAVAAAFFWIFDNDSGYTICTPSGKIYTVNENQPTAECLLVRGSRLAHVGSFDEVQAASKDSTPWLSKLTRREHKIFYTKENEIIVPGLADAHAHVIENGFKMQLPLETAVSASDAADLVKKYIQSHPELESNRSQWIEGMGWDQTKWPGGEFPTAAIFAEDPILADRPISLRRVDGHALWVSPRVLELLGDLPRKVKGGIIIRDSNDRPTGIFLDNAMGLVPLPRWSETQMDLFFDATMKEALKYGLTSIHDAAAEPHMISFLRKKAKEGKLPLRLYLMGTVLSDEYWGNQIPRLINYGKHSRLNLRSVKLFADGALGSWGAALLEPYTDKPDTSGILRISSSTLRGLVNEFCRDGWQVNIHCIGDRANQVVLDIFEEILETGGVNASEWRPRIEHAQIMTPEDLERVGRLGVITSVQPKHAASDMPYAEARLGPERMKGAYAYQTLLQSSPNRILPLGSDFPVEGVNPLLGFHAATSRPDSPKERLTRAQALKGMTLDAAYASFAEKELGSLEVGKKADFVVFDRDFMVDGAGAGDVRAKATVVDGEVAYGGL